MWGPIVTTMPFMLGFSGGKVLPRLCMDHSWMVPTRMVESWCRLSTQSELYLLWYWATTEQIISPTGSSKHCKIIPYIQKVDYHIISEVILQSSLNILEPYNSSSYAMDAVMTLALAMNETLESLSQNMSLQASIIHTVTFTGASVRVTLYTYMYMYVHQHWLNYHNLL